jgi:signal transduction histidine kinase
MTIVEVLVVIVLGAWTLTAARAARARSALAWWALAAATVAGLGLVDGGRDGALALGTVVLTGSLLSLPAGELSTRRWATTGVVAVGALGGLAWRPLAWAVLVAGGVIGVRGAVQSARAAGADERRRIQAVLVAAVAALELGLSGLLLGMLLRSSGSVTEVALAASLTLPVALALLLGERPGTWVDRALVVAVVGGGTLGLLAGVALTVVVGLGGRPVGPQREAVFVSLLAAGVAAALFPAVHGRLRSTANRLVYGAVESPDDVARSFSSRLTRAIPLDELLLQLAETLRRALRLEAAEVWTGSGGAYGLAASVPHVAAGPIELSGRELDVVARAGPSGGTWVTLWLPELAHRHDPARLRVTPLAHAGQLLGLLVTRRPEGADPYDERDDQVLADLARQMGAALHNVALDTALADSMEELRRTNEELRASRARVVASGDAQRRRIERDLHDGAQQRLVALAVKLRLASDALAEGDVDDTSGLLDEIRTDLTDTIAELRSLAHGIYPPLLASGGLVEALPAAAARSVVPATVVSCPRGRYPQAVETAVYFCCLEALQNAAKHAGPGASVRIDAAEHGGWLTFSVADDGVGFVADGRAGQGLVNMTDRVGAVGGTVEVVSAPGRGTRVSARLPLGAAATAPAEGPASGLATGPAGGSARGSAAQPASAGAEAASAGAEAAPAR